MATYSTPGVYVNEGTLSSIAPTVNGGTSAVFFGAAERGPSTPTLITDWTSYKRTYGDLKNAYDLGYAVYHYFTNGGRSCYVTRVVGTASTSIVEGAPVTSTITPKKAAVGGATAFTDANNDTTNLLGVTYYPQGSAGDPAPDPVVLFDAQAISAGTWGNGLTLSVSAGLVDTSDTRHGTFTIAISLDGVEVERWPEVTIDPDGNRYVQTVVNTYSKYIEIGNVSTVAPDEHLDWVTTAFAFSGGLEADVADSDFTAAVELVDTIQGNLILNAVGQTSSTVVTALMNKAVERGDAFVIIDPLKNADDLTTLTNTASNFSGLTNGGYAAHYAPALKMVDPAKTGPGAIRVTYPGGAIAGLYVRTDTQRSVSKAPAGYGAEIRGALGLAFPLSDADIGTLYDGAPYVNSFKSIPGAGVVVYGSRTLARTTSDKFIPVRRTLNYLKFSLKQLTEFAVFEPNDRNLWSRIESSLSGFLGEFYRTGGLRGQNTAQAFYVVCNETNNTPLTIDQGIVNVEVGVALQYPAEFIVINLSQWSGGANTAETL